MRTALFLITTLLGAAALPAEHDAALARDGILASELEARDPYDITSPHFDLAARQALGKRCAAGLRAVSKGVPASPNGCGTKGFKVPNFAFGTCCNNHDRCYADCSQTRQTCDAVFTTCMVNVCMNKYKWYNPVRAVCLSGAATYGGAVTAAGEIAFDNATKKHCKCVK